MKKKFLALVLTLAMVLSLVPVGALAVDEDAQDTPANDDVITYQAGTPKENYPDGLTTLNKQAEKISGKDNQYKVTLTVGMSQTKNTVVTSTKAATVLVIDISNSMDWHVLCGRDEHTHTRKCYSFGILTCGKTEHTHTDACGESRLDAAKTAAKNFVNTYAGSVENADRYLSIVVFGTTASVKLDWTDVSTDDGKENVISAIDEISVNGGTNLEQGLAKAKDRFDDPTVASVNFKNVVALTDGAPTYYGLDNKGEPSGGNGSSGSEEINTKTAKTAGKLKEVANLYTVCFGAANQHTYEENHFWGTTYGPTVGNFLRGSIATDSNHAYNADNAGQLNNAFKEISENITSGLSAGTVHDALPDGVSSEAFGEGTTAKWDLSTFETKTYNEGDTTHYTYTKTYTVTIDPEKIAPEKLENGYYPLNDRTTLTVKTGDTDTVLDFPIPAGKVTAKITYVLNDGENAASNPKTYVCGVGVDSFADATRTGYTFEGWYSDSSYTNKVTTISKTEVGDKTLYAKWEKDGSQTKKLSYTVEYYKDNKKVVSDTQTVTKDVWVNATKLTVDKDKINTTDKYAGTGYKFDKTEPGTIPNEVTGGTVIKVYYVKDDSKTKKLTYTVEYYKDGQRVDDDTQTVTKDVWVNATKLTVDKDKINTTDKYAGTGYKFDKTEPGTIPNEVTGGTTIKVYYYLDNWKDADETTDSDDKDSETGGDGIPDCYQVLVNYKSGDTNRGSVGPRTMEVLTIKNTEDKWASTGTVKASGSTATATGSRCYFSSWTNDADVNTSNAPATLGQQTFNAEGGKTYTFTANFDRSSGGGSGGSNRPKPPVVEIPDDVPTGLNGKDHYAYVVGYPDGMVYPQKNITRAEVATIFFRLLKDETREANMTKSNGYNDMKEGAWYTCAVSTLSKMGIIKGYEDGSFKPDASISRAEFAAIAARFDPDGDKTPATFSDVSSHWAKDEISIAANHGWIKGYEDGSFKPDQKITRAETMTLVNRVLKRLPETKDDLHKDMKTWPDNQNESAWFYLAVQEATNSHYQKLKKDGTHETWESMRETRDWAALEK